MSPETPIASPDRRCAMITPITANGTELSSTSGCNKDRNAATMITYTISTDDPSASISCVKARLWSFATPAIS